MNQDHRGSFTEVFQRHWGTCLTPVQWSVVQSKAGVMRGVHLHKRHDEYFALLSGHAYVGLRDMRPGSPTEDVSALFEFSGAQLACLVFPLGLLHGWYFSEDSLHLQAVSESYVDYHKEDNLGCFWGDPDIGIPWPFQTAIVTQRAQDFPTFKALSASLADWQPYAPPAGKTPRA